MGASSVPHPQAPQAAATVRLMRVMLSFVKTDATSKSRRDRAPNRESQAFLPRDSLGHMGDRGKFRIDNAAGPPN